MISSQAHRIPTRPGGFISFFHRWASINELSVARSLWRRGLVEGHSVRLAICLCGSLLCNDLTSSGMHVNKPSRVLGTLTSRPLCPKKEYPPFMCRQGPVPFWQRPYMSHGGSDGRGNLGSARSLELKHNGSHSSGPARPSTRLRERVEPSPPSCGSKGAC